MAVGRVVCIPVRQTRGGTPNIQDVARRGEGGVRLSIGDGRYAMMTEADVALSVEARAALVAQRVTANVVEISLEAPSLVAPLSASQVAPLDLGLLFDPNSNIVAMRAEVTVGLMRQFVENTEYVPKGHERESFNGLIANGNASSPMVYTNRADYDAFIAWALPRAQAFDPRIQTLGLPSDGEWLSMRQAFRGEQTGSNWERLSDNYFRSFRFEYRSYGGNPGGRGDGGAFRLVGTYKN